jgi:hypothetical protein
MTENKPVEHFASSWVVMLLFNTMRQNFEVANPDPKFRHNERYITPQAVVLLDLTSDQDSPMKFSYINSVQDPAAR